MRIRDDDIMMTLRHITGEREREIKREREKEGKKP